MVCFQRWITQGGGDAGLIQTDGLWRAALSLTNTVRFFQLQSP
jgi:hypothetical protein